MVKLTLLLQIKKAGFFFLEDGGSHFSLLNRQKIRRILILYLLICLQCWPKAEKSLRDEFFTFLLILGVKQSGLGERGEWRYG